MRRARAAIELRGHQGLVWALCLRKLHPRAFNLPGATT